MAQNLNSPPPTKKNGFTNRSVQVEVMHQEDLNCLSSEAGLFKRRITPQDRSRVLKNIGKLDDEVIII